MQPRPIRVVAGLNSTFVILHWTSTKDQPHPQAPNSNLLPDLRHKEDNPNGNRESTSFLITIKMTTIESRLTSLPVELQGTIFRYLDPIGLLYTSQTCRTLRALIKVEKIDFI